MMLLGLVLHSAITFGVINYGNAWPIKDPGTTNLSNDFIVSFIHTFRIPIFFVVAGFFGAMLFYERTPLKMIKNRVSRIVYPFIAFVLLLWPTIVFTFSYTRLTFAGSDNALAETLAIFSNPLVFIPQMTFHLWFLYYLILITIVSVLLALLFKKLPKLSSNISKAFNWILQKPKVRVLVFVGLTCLVYLIMGISSVETSSSFIPDINTFIFYFFFYIVGWVLFKSKQLLESMMRLDWACTISGIILFTVYFFVKQSLSYELVILISSFIVWLFIFGITGLFIRYGNHHSSRMRYISDASYWVYLVHLSFTAIIPAFLFNWDVPATVKFLTVLTITTFICFSTYHCFVRYSFIGKFLNGKKYSRKLSDINKAEELPKLKTDMDK
jgi:hypothetical protein